MKRVIVLELSLLLILITQSSCKNKRSDVITKSFGMKFVWIPAGEFIMGSSGEPHYKHDEDPIHRVKISKGFWMSQTEVTQKQWKAVMGYSKNSYFQGDNLPVGNVSYDDAYQFCVKLSSKEGKTYRLPTEAEWEYACRAGTRTPYNTGETISPNQANYNHDGSYIDLYSPPADRVNHKTTVEVASFQPNAFGLYDMHGNVSEWCDDLYFEDYYSISPEVDPRYYAFAPEYNRERTRGQTTAWFVLRGGSYASDLISCRSAARSRGPRGSWGSGNEVIGSSCGFRVVLGDWPNK